MIIAIIRKLANLVDYSASEGKEAGLLVDELGRLHVTPSGGQAPSSPPAASSVGSLTFAVGTSAASLSGTSPSGFTLLNASTGGQEISLGDAGVVVTPGTPRFVLAPGAALDRASWQDLSIVYAVATAGGAELLAVPL